MREGAALVEIGRDVVPMHELGSDRHDAARLYAGTREHPGPVDRSRGIANDPRRTLHDEMQEAFRPGVGTGQLTGAKDPAMPLRPSTATLPICCDDGELTSVDARRCYDPARQRRRTRYRVSDCVGCVPALFTHNSCSGHEHHLCDRLTSRPSICTGPRRRTIRAASGRLCRRDQGNGGRCTRDDPSHST